MLTSIPSATRTQPARPAPGNPGNNPWLLWSIETPAEREVLSVAQLAECSCPDLCDRDHPNE
jgi:hypothetical protein